VLSTQSIQYNFRNIDEAFQCDGTDDARMKIEAVDSTGVRWWDDDTIYVSKIAKTIMDISILSYYSRTGLVGALVC